MKVVAYTPLHYGKEYLKWAVQSVADFVDRHIILYAPQPSYGHGTDLICPDTEEQLRECVREFPHVEWRRVAAHNESQHRGEIHRYLEANDDILLAIDADEVWNPWDLERCLEALNREVKYLSLFCADWAAWDDTYEFVAEPNQKYIEANLVIDTFTGNNISLIYTLHLYVRR